MIRLCEQIGLLARATNHAKQLSRLNAAVNYALCDIVLNKRITIVKQAIERESEKNKNNVLATLKRTGNQIVFKIVANGLRSQIKQFLCVYVHEN